jgi:hypothetical protein
MLKSACSILLCLLVHLALAQEATPDSLRTRPPKPDSLKIKFYPRAIRFGTDILSLVKTYTMEDFSGWEANVDIDCGRIYFAGDVGSWGKTLSLNTRVSTPTGITGTQNSGQYENLGTYWRVGADINLLTKDPDKNMFFFGLRYAQSAYNESATIVLEDALYGTITQQVSNDHATAAWGEAVVGLKVKIWKNFWMGYTGRMKFLPSVKGDTGFKTYDIPGYGLNDRKLYWGFNYQIFFNIPFVKEKKRLPLISK